MNAALRVGTWNACGLSGRIDVLVDVMVRCDVDVVFVNETWMAPYSSPPHACVILNDPNPLGENEKLLRRNSYGVAIVIHPKHLHNAAEFKISDRGVPGKSIAFSWKGITFIGVYLSPRWTDDECKHLLSYMTDGRGGPIVLMGDFNMKIPSPEFGQTPDSRGMHLLPWIEELGNGLGIRYPEVYAPTWLGHTGKASMVDYMFASWDLAARWHHTEILTDTDIGGSDHRLVYASIGECDRLNSGSAQGSGIGANATREAEKFHYVRYNTKLLEKSEFLTGYRTAVAKALAVPGARPDHADMCGCQLCVDAIDKELTEAIHAAASGVLKEVTVRKHRVKLTGPRIRAADKFREYCRKRWMEVEKLPHSCAEMRKVRAVAYKEAKEAFTEAIALEKKRLYLNHADHMAEQPMPVQQKVAHRIKRLRLGGTAQGLGNGADDMPVYEKYFSDMFAWNRFHNRLPQAAIPTGEPGEAAGDVPFDEDMIMHLIRTSRRGKAGGKSGISNELLIPVADVIVKPVTGLFMRIWEGGHCPTSWKCALIHPLWKKGDKSSISNYRPITLTEVFRKLFERAIDDHLTMDCVEPLSHYQGGFRAGRGAPEQIACLHESVRQFHQTHRRAPAMAFLDIKAAYDTVDRERLWEKMRARGCSSNLMRVLRSLFDDNTSSVVVRGATTGPIRHHVGLLQGSVLSPKLYSVFIDDITNALMRESTLEMAGMPVGVYMYADDIALLARSREDMQALLQICEAHSNENGYRFAPGKCVVVADGPVENFLYGEALPQQDQFTYLGMIFGCTGMNTKAQVALLASKGQKCLNFFRTIGMNDGGYRLITNIMLVNTFVRPCMEYCLQFLGKTETAPLQRVLSDALRGILAAPRNTSCAALHALAGVDNMETRRIRQ